MTKSHTALCWLRRDLRLDDNATLEYAARSHERLVCVFIFDQQILETLPRKDRRVEFIWHAVQQLKQRLQEQGSDLLVVSGQADEQISILAQQYSASSVIAAEDYEPAARARDQLVADQLQASGRQLVLVKDQLIFARDEILTKNHTPYSVFTPYKNAWLARLTPAAWIACQTPPTAALPATPMPSLQDIGFEATDLTALGIPLGERGGQELLQAFVPLLAEYQQQRDFPDLDATSHLSPHLRFGTISIRAAVALAAEQPGPGPACWLSELIWREFYQQLLWHYPHISQESFKAHYRNLEFGNRQDWFDAWCQGKTGYPLIDAAMRQLNQTGWMHNRLRMICASFLVKDLLIDWRWGEQYFAEQLLDFDLAANNGGWQWAASTGCDAQPYFRIFNPVTQSSRFDPEGRFIRRFVPELAAFGKRDIHAPWQARTLPLGFALGRDYPEPIVDHAIQRERALKLFDREG